MDPNALFQNGVALAVLAWFMLKMVPSVERLERAVDRLTNAVCLALGADKETLDKVAGGGNDAV